MLGLMFYVVISFSKPFCRVIFDLNPSLFAAFVGSP